MAKMPASELITKLVDIATKYKTLYVQGCFGALLTPNNAPYYKHNTKYNRQADRQQMIDAAATTQDTFGFDCVCVIKGVLWGWNGSKTAAHGGAVHGSNEVPDIGTEQIINVCNDISTDFSYLIPGELLWRSGHVGIYIGDGLAVECTPTWANKVQITSCNCDKEEYHRRDWIKHGKLPYVDYEYTEEINITQKLITPEDIKEKTENDTIYFQFRDRVLQVEFSKIVNDVLSQETEEVDTTQSQDFNAKLLWFICKEMGYTKEMAAGLMGHLCGESCLAPGLIEGYYKALYTPDSFILSLFNENNQLNVQAMHNYVDNILFPMYDAQNVKYSPQGYLRSNGYYGVGIGIAQWTGSGVDRLSAFANAINKKWYEIDCQLAALFCISHNDQFISLYNEYKNNHAGYTDIQFTTRIALGSFGMPGWRFYQGYYGRIGPKIEYAEYYYALFKDLTINDLTEQERNRIQAIVSIINNYNKNKPSLTIDSNEITLKSPLLLYNDQYNYDIDITPLIDPYLIHNVTINGEKITINNNKLLLKDAIDRYINQKVLEYKTTQYLQIFYNSHSLINNNQILDITNNIISLIKQELEEKVNAFKF